MIDNKKATQATVTVTTASILVLPSNTRRRYGAIHNSGSAGIWLSLGVAAVAGTSIYVPPNGGAFVLEGENLWRGEVYAIAASGSNVIGTLELQ